MDPYLAGLPLAPRMPYDAATQKLPPKKNS